MHQLTFKLACAFALVILVVAGCGETGPAYGATSGQTGTAAAARVAPADRRIRWKIGAIDERFRVSSEQLIRAAKRATGVWEAAAGRTLFVEDESNGIPINLVFDERQARRNQLRATDRVLTKLEVQIETFRNRHANSKSAFDQSELDFAAKQRELSKAIQEHNSRVDYWNLHNGAPDAERAEIDQEEAGLKAAQERQADDRDRIDALRSEANLAADRYNSAVRKYNSIVAETAKRFGSNWKEKVGEFESIGDRTWSREINVYAFDNLNELVSILAHEFGHALGIEHVQDSRALMNAVSRDKRDSTAIELTPDDRAALQAILARYQ